MFFSANATIYNQQQYDYLNSDVYRSSICTADPDTVPTYPEKEDFCMSQSCETDNVHFFIFFSILIHVIKFLAFNRIVFHYFYYGIMII